MTFKTLIGIVELTILDPGPDEFLYFKQDNCKYKIRNTKKNLESFLKRLKHPMFAHRGSPSRTSNRSKIAVINEFIKDKEFDNAINAIALTDLHFGIGAAKQNKKPIFYFPVETATMWDRSVFITENDEIIDTLSGGRIGKKGIVLTVEQEIILSKAPDNYNKLLQELLS
jgi:hypothetical protein